VYYQTFTAVVVKLSECVGNATGIIMPANLGTDLAKKKLQMTVITILQMLLNWGKGF